MRLISFSSESLYTLLSAVADSVDGEVCLVTGED
jgi:hypothetical protein